MEDLPLDPVVVEMAIPEEYEDMHDEFFNDLSRKVGGEYVTDLKRVISREYVFLEDSVDDPESDDVDPREFAYFIDKVDLEGVIVETIFGDAQELTHREIKASFDVVMFDAFFETYLQ